MPVIIAPDAAKLTNIAEKVKEHRVQGRMLMGHAAFDVSAVYVLPDPANLGRVLKMAEDIILEIEQLWPGDFTVKARRLRLVSGRVA